MKPIFILLGLGLYGASVLAQTATGLNEGSRLEYDSNSDTWSFSWWGKSGRSYFPQHSTDLMTWNYVPIIESGADDILSWGFSTTSERFFTRLKYSDAITADPWNYDFDGDFLTAGEELSNGLDPFSAADDNSNSVPDDWEAVHQGEFSVWPPDLRVSISRGQTAQEQLLLWNGSASDVTYSIILTNNIGTGYSAKDSVNGSAVYAWEDISTTGGLLLNASDFDDDFDFVGLTGFSFPFYGINYSGFYISTNGLITFETGNSSYSNGHLPDASLPAAIAVFWDDLNPSDGGDVYFKEEMDRAIVQWEAVERFHGGGTYTFQAVLYDDGRIALRYKTMNGLLDSATVGVQDSTGVSALEFVANSSSAIDDGVAVDLHDDAEFFSLGTLSGTVLSGETVALNATFRSFSMPPGNYVANIEAIHDDSGVTSPINTTATLTVEDSPGTITLEHPSGSATLLEGDNLSVDAYGTDPDGVDRVEFYWGASKLGESTYGPYYSDYLYDLNPGSAQLFARLVDSYGATYDSSSITLTVLADSDADGLSDAWEMIVFAALSDPLSQLADGDYDNDGYTNLEEYQLGNDPTVAENSDNDPIPDGWEIRLGLNPNMEDSDGDGTLDGDEDTDSDELTNIAELQIGTNPAHFDTDGDLLPDGWEVAFGLNPLNQDQDGNSKLDHEDDFDGDGLNNLGESGFGANPTVTDTDGDGTTDGDEADQGSFPSDPSDDGEADPPYNPDPSDPGSPSPPGPNDFPTIGEPMRVKLTVGDPSGSNSERYALDVTDITTGNTFTHMAPDFGEVGEQVYGQFRFGHAYKFCVRHLGTDPDYLRNNDEPDYDGEAGVEIVDSPNSLGDLLYVFLDPFDPATQSIRDDEPHLLGSWNNEDNFPTGLGTYEAYMLPVEIAVTAGDHIAGGTLVPSDIPNAHDLLRSTGVRNYINIAEFPPLPIALQARVVGAPLPLTVRWQYRDPAVDLMPGAPELTPEGIPDDNHGSGEGFITSGGGTPSPTIDVQLDQENISTALFVLSDFGGDNYEFGVSVIGGGMVSSGPSEPVWSDSVSVWRYYDVEVDAMKTSDGASVYLPPYAGVNRVFNEVFIQLEFIEDQVSTSTGGPFVNLLSADCGTSATLTTVGEYLDGMKTTPAALHLVGVRAIFLGIRYDGWACGAGATATLLAHDNTVRATVDTESIVAHEIGHTLLGPGHPDPEGVMRQNVNLGPISAQHFGVISADEIRRNPVR